MHGYNAIFLFISVFIISVYSTYNDDDDYDDDDLRYKKKHNDLLWLLSNQSHSVIPSVSDSFQPTPRSAPTFLRINNTHAILFNGYLEIIAINRGLNNVFFNDVWILDKTNPNIIKWSLISNNTSPAPPPRSIECSVFSRSLNKLFIYGGTTFNADQSQPVFFNDTWSFDVTTRTWQFLGISPAGTRAGHGCDIIQETNEYITTHGLRDAASNFLNDTWRWNLNTNTWTLLATSANRPASRFQFGFGLLPNTNGKFIFIEGFRPPIFFNDIWIFNLNNLQWTQLNVKNHPQFNISNPAYTILSKDLVLVTGGDKARNLLTTAITCRPPLQCILTRNPTNDNYFIHVDAFYNIARWSDELKLEASIPPLSKPATVFFPRDKRVYLTSGLGWDGQHGVGEIFNPYTWTLDLDRKGG